MATGYEDIDRLVNRQSQMLDESLQKQNDIVNKQTQMQVDSLARQKEDIDRETIQQNRALYQDYRKANNPFGQQAENLASQGLGNSGYAETTQSRLYNTYQNNITSTLNNARKLKADVDFQIQQARQTGDITLAQNSLELYKQKMQLLSQEYDLRNNREQFLYQQSRDKVADNQWKKEFDYKKSVDKRNFKYQKQRDKVSDTHWEKEYALSKKARASSSRSSRRATGGSNDLVTNVDINTGNSKNTKKNSADSALKALGNSKVVKLLESGAKQLARPIIMGGVLTYNKTKGKQGISEKQAEAIFKKYGL